MDAARWERIQEIFHAATGRPAAGRRAFVQSQAAGDATLAADVLGMLEEDERAGSLLDRELGSVADRVLHAGGEPPLPPHAFGPYRAVRFLGEGGMGVVFLAERADLGSRAAIKILRDAWISPARRERFAAEQRLLAQMNHPSIARLFDAGTLPDGTPWIAMEHVEGVPLTEHCERRNLSLRERLSIFRAVCEAVRYAHRSAVLHRDLKPSNLLVREDGTIKLLDFGIAKSLDEAEDAPDRTRTAWRLATPAYGAPEQWHGGPLGLYTDVWALGVILYELLAGGLPFDGPADGAREAAPPSAAARSRLGRASWAELDVLCLTAMHPDPARRYPTVDALLRDVDHYLAGEPLEARPAGAAYRLRKFAARHRVPLAAAAAVLASVVSLVAYYGVRLAAARDAAVAEAARRERIQTFMFALFGGDEDAAPSDSLRVVELLDRGLVEARLLEDEPLVRAELDRTLGTLYSQLGHLDRGDSLLVAALERRRATLGAEHVDVGRTLVELGSIRLAKAEMEDAERLVREGLAVVRRAAPRGSPAVPEALTALGQVLAVGGRYDEASATLEEALARMERDGATDEELAAGLHELANVEFYAGDYAASDSLNRAVLAVTRRMHGDRHPSVADDLINLGATRHQLGLYAEAESTYRTALDIHRSWYGDGHPKTATNRTMLARTLVAEERLEEAEAELSKSLATLEAVHGGHHPSVASALNERGLVAWRRGALDAAAADFQRMVEIYRDVYGPAHDFVGVGLSNLASVAMGRGDFAQAEARLREALDLFTRSLGPGHMNVAIARIKHGRALLRLGRPDEAEAEIRGGYELLSAQADPGVSWLAAAREDLLEIYERRGDAARAAEMRAAIGAVATPTAAPARPAR